MIIDTFRAECGLVERAFVYYFYVFEHQTKKDMIFIRRNRLPIGLILSKFYSFCWFTISLDFRNHEKRTKNVKQAVIKKYSEISK